MVFTIAQEDYCKKRDSPDIIEQQHTEEEDSKEKVKEPWVLFDEEQTTKS